MYKLKGESFTVVDGPEAGKKFVRGSVYDTIPQADAGKFETIPEENPGDAAEPAKEYYKTSKKKEDK